MYTVLSSISHLAQQQTSFLEVYIVSFPKDSFGNKIKLFSIATCHKNSSAVGNVCGLLFDATLSEAYSV